MESKELSSPRVQLPSSFQNISDCKPLWCCLWIGAELNIRLAPIPNLSKLSKGEKKPISAARRCQGSGRMWDQYCLSILQIEKDSEKANPILSHTPELQQSAYNQI